MKSTPLYAFLLLASCAISDTLYFHNGATLNGKIIQESKQTLTIDVAGKKTTYSMSDIKDVKRVTAAPPPPAIAPPPKVTASHIIKSGTVISIKTQSEVSSRQHKSGHQFTVTLTSNITNQGKIIVPAGATLYATVVESQQAGRLVGNSSLVVTLSAIMINGKKVSLTTNTLNVKNSTSQTKNSSKKLIRGAAIGALINGHEGARDGAKVGAGAAILTRGEATGVPTGTLLDFTITQDVKL